MWAVRWGVLFAGVSLAYCRQAYSANWYPWERDENDSQDVEAGQTIMLQLPATKAILDPRAKIRRSVSQPTRTPETVTQKHFTDQTIAPVRSTKFATQPSRTPDPTIPGDYADQRIVPVRSRAFATQPSRTPNPTTPGDYADETTTQVMTTLFETQPSRTPDPTTPEDFADETTSPMLSATYDTPATRTPDPAKIDEIKGAIEQILAGRNIDPHASFWTAVSKATAENDFTDIYDYMLKLQSAKDLDQSPETSETGTPRATENPTTKTPDSTATSPLTRTQADKYSKDIQRQINKTDNPDTKKTTASKLLDVDTLLDIVANLTYDYDMDFVSAFNESLQKYSMPTSCATTTTVATTMTMTTTPTTTVEMSTYPIEDSPVVAKCFVCGLDMPEIPMNAHCADAFAGDFIPLVPVDPSAKGQIARFRKYCRYLDVNNYVTDRREPRSLFGRWTGGCSVRWTDLSGVYTQRSCRNQHRATTGRHFGSKRMAKLEMTLNHVDNGCVVSPMASLLPLSRGISLFARFHACVCTGSWCNRAYRSQRWIPEYWILTIWLMSKN